MVKVKEQKALESITDIDSLLYQINNHYYLTNMEQIKKACLLVESVRNSKNTDIDWPENYTCLQVGLEMMLILLDLKVDNDCLVAGILYRSVFENKIELTQVEESFGNSVATLINSVKEMGFINHINSDKNQDFQQSKPQLEKIRKMLVSIIDDVRVALIKLAERVCAIRSVKYSDDHRKKIIAQEVFEIYAPLAHRLGIGYIKWELEDLSFRYLRSNEYKSIAKLLDEKRLDRENYIENVLIQLRKSLKDSQIICEVYGRPKHIYSIWKKMDKKNLNFRELYDIRAFRIITDHVKDCYGALGVVHSLYNHIPKEFDDYIATPKENGYRSLHTAVFGPLGKTLEVQIRTKDMHEESELGVCAHWKYKGTDINSKTDSYEEKLNWLRQVMEWHEELGDDSDIGQDFRAEIEPDRVYVFSRNGHVIDLPVGATPIDFAFRIHTEIGLKCRGAKVCGRIVPLHYSLKTGEQVEILTSKNAHPSRDWINSNLKYVATSKARAKILSWLKQQNREENIINGQFSLDQEIKRLGFTVTYIKKNLTSTPFNKTEDLYAAIGAGDFKVAQFIRLLYKSLPKYDDNIKFIEEQVTYNKKESKSSVSILGVGNLLTQMAGCCQPVPDDKIIGYITLGRGVSIHKQDCMNILKMQEQEPERIIEVNWGEEHNECYPVEIKVIAYDRSGLLRDITFVLANEKVNVRKLSTSTEKEEHLAHMSLFAEVKDLQQLSVVLTKLNKLPNVIDSYRLRNK